MTNPHPLTPPLMRFRKRRFGCSKMFLCLTTWVTRSEYCITLQSVPYRPPQLRCVTFPPPICQHKRSIAYLPSIPSDSYWASTCLAVLPDIPSLICDFCPSDQRFAIQLPSDFTSRWTPLPLAVSFPLSGHFTDLHRLDYAHAGRTKN